METVVATVAKLRHLRWKQYWWQQWLKRQWSWRGLWQIQRWLQRRQATINKTAAAVLTAVVVNNQQNGAGSVDSESGEDNDSDTGIGNGDDGNSSTEHTRVVKRAERVARQSSAQLVWKWWF